MPSVDTFDLRPESFDLSTNRRAVATDRSGGTYQRRQTQSSKSRNTSSAKSRTWRLTWSHGRYKDAVRLRELWSKSIAGSLTLDWTPPDEVSAIRVHMGSHSVTQQTANDFEMVATLEEAI